MDRPVHKAGSPDGDEFVSPAGNDPQALCRRITELEGQLERAFEVGEAAARRSALQYRNLFDHSPVSIWEEDFSALVRWFGELRRQGITDLRAYLAEHPEALDRAASLVRIVRVNRAALKLMKIPDATGLVGSLLDILKDETRQVFTEELAALWEGRERISLEGTGRDGEGRRFHYVLNMLVPVEAGQPRLEAVVAVITDITELVEAREALRRSQSEKTALLNSIPDTVLSVDPGFRLLECNRDLVAVCPEAAGLSPGDKVDAGERRDCPWVDVLRQTLKDQVPVSGVKAACDRCGRVPRVFEMSGAPLKDACGGFSGAVLVVRDVTRLERLEQELSAMRGRSGMGRLKGKSQAMQKVYSLIEQLAQVDSLVLINGQSGTGKELVAESLHFTGPRSKGPLIKVNCSALSENLLESELFGHMRGAFSGAIRDKQGRFEAAEGGTLFLDEIGDISSLLQLKLLRVMESREFERVGDNRTRRADVRLVAATNADLAGKVRAGSFREDLYYRLNVVNIHLPPLRERKEDIPLLVEHFVDEFARAMGKDIRGADPEVLERFLRHHWPGNVRELRHAVEHACILCRGPLLLPGHLPELGQGFQDPACSGPGGPAPADLTPDDLTRALERAKGKKAKAARLLGVSRSTLYRRLEEFGLDRKS